jgi:HEAT repeat protein
MIDQSLALNCRLIIKSLILFVFIVLSIALFISENVFAQNEKIKTNDIKQTKELQNKLSELKTSISETNSPEGKDQKEPAKKENENNKINPDKKSKDNSLETDIPQKKNEKIIDVNTVQNKVTGDAYAKEKKKTEWIINTIDNGTHKDRKYAINEILTIKDPGLKNKLGEKLVDLIKNEVELEVRIKAVSVTGEIKVKEAVPNLVSSLNDNSEDLAVTAVYAIKKIGDTSAKPALIARLKEQKFESNTNLTEALIDTLGEFKSAELISFASQIINDIKTDQIVRELLVLFLGKTESKEPKMILSGVLNDEDEKEQIRAFAANSLANLKITEAIPDIDKVIQTIDSYPFNKKKKYYNLYIYCIAALVKLGDEKVFPYLQNALRSDNAVVRLKAVALIKGMNDKRSVDILKYKMFYDPSQKVQNAAKEALKELGVDVKALKKDDTKNEFDNKNDIKKDDSTKGETKDEPLNE